MVQTTTADQPGACRIPQEFLPLAHPLHTEQAGKLQPRLEPQLETQLQVQLQPQLALFLNLVLGPSWCPQTKPPDLYRLV